MNPTMTLPAAAAGTFSIGGDLTVKRMGLWCHAHHRTRNVGTSCR
jgi:hypothetical protein